MAVTMQQIAEMVGVSRPVVSAVLSGSSQTVGVSPERAAMIRKVAQELGYRKQWRSRILKDGRTRLVGLLGTSDSSTKFGINDELMRGLTDGLSTRGLALTYIQTGAGHHELLMDGRFDGCLIDFVVQPEQIDALHTVGLPGVIINAEARAGISAVRIDEVGAFRQAVDHLLALGHRRICYCDNQPDTRRAAVLHTELVGRRLRAWKQVIESHRDEAVAWSTVAVPSTYRWKPVEAIQKSGLESLLAKPLADRPTACICFDPGLAFVVSEAAEARGMRYPADLSVMSIDDSLVLEMRRTAISAVAPDFYRVGRVSTERLLSLIDARKELSAPTAPEDRLGGEDILVASHLKVRASTAPPPSA